VIVAEPTETPVTMPPADTVASPVADHVPPLIVPVNVIEDPTQTGPVPEMAAVGNGVTVIV
jgi:hypothetical protein